MNGKWTSQHKLHLKPYQNQICSIDMQYNNWFYCNKNHIISSKIKQTFICYPLKKKEMASLFERSGFYIWVIFPYWIYCTFLIKIFVLLVLSFFYWTLIVFKISKFKHAPLADMLTLHSTLTLHRISISVSYHRGLYPYNVTG